MMCSVKRQLAREKRDLRASDRMMKRIEKAEKLKLQRALLREVRQIEREMQQMAKKGRK